MSFEKELGIQAREYFGIVRLAPRHFLPKSVISEIKRHRSPNRIYIAQDKTFVLLRKTETCGPIYRSAVLDRSTIEDLGQRVLNAATRTRLATVDANVKRVDIKPDRHDTTKSRLIVSLMDPSGTLQEDRAKLVQAFESEVGETVNTEGYAEDLTLAVIEGTADASAMLPKIERCMPSVVRLGFPKPVIYK